MLARRRRSWRSVRRRDFVRTCTKSILIALAWLMVAFLITFPALVRPARADESSSAAPIVAPPVDVRAFVGKTVSAVDISVTQSGWEDPQKPEIRALRPGDVLTMDK